MISSSSCALDSLTLQRTHGQGRSSPGSHVALRTLPCVVFLSSAGLPLNRRCWRRALTQQQQRGFGKSSCVSVGDARGTALVYPERARGDPGLSRSQKKKKQGNGEQIVMQEDGVESGLNFGDLPVVMVHPHSSHTSGPSTKRASADHLPSGPLSEGHGQRNHASERRPLLLSLLSAFSSIVVHHWWFQPRDALAAEVATSEDAATRSGGTSRILPASLALDLSSWPLFIGTGFALKVPPGFEDVMPREEVDDSPQSTLRMQNKAQKTPFVARFASGDEMVSVLTQPATKVKLTFFEVEDVSALGTIDEAASLFISSNAKILARREYSTAWYGKKQRTYYLYEFVSGGVHVAMSVSAADGSVFVLGASAPDNKWKPAAGRLRATAGAFQLTV